ncbi:MAG: fibronectin type III domain-containing protein [Candidatus Sungbacteria bacterium]|uniref:Fibronectin type III domain-containing protein n=1 Tax=Candidatus Sungiibacteriota bacterium TaxID=2750080 RepID=A0A9D6LTT6_9BACT|nr:fibronectin type III domain-containing protein [Candidatus Sungbacteria bacterium]
MYPEGLVTGYFGPLTEAAVKKLQEKQGIEAIGIVGPKTAIKINELLTQGAGASGIVPPGLTTAPGIQQKLGETTTTIPPTATTTTSTSTSTPPTAIATTTLAVTPNTGSSAVPPPVTASPPTTTSTTATTSTNATSDTTSPSVPTNLSASAVSTSQINLSWLNSTDNVGVSGYKIYRSGAQIATAVASTSATATAAYSDTGLQASTAYTYAVAAYDATGNNSAQSASASATTQSPPPAYNTPPVISSVAVSSITSNSAMISWITDVPATGFVNYGTPTIGIVTPENTSYLTSHSFTISNLAASALYNFRVYSHNAYGDQTDLVSGYPPNRTFTTLSGPPSCSSINVTLNDGKTTYIKGVDNFVNYTWTCAPGGSADVNVGIQKPGGWISLNTTTNSPTQTLFIDISSDSYPIGTYRLEACFNVCGSIVAGQTFSISSPPVDTTPPVISSLRVDVAYSSAMASWTALPVWITDEPSTSQVEFGLTSSYGTITPLDSSGAFLRTVHSIILSPEYGYNLTSNTTYHYRMISKDAQWNSAVSGDYTFTTASSTTSADFTHSNLASIFESLRSLALILQKLQSLFH